MLALREGVWTVIWKQSGVMALELEVTAAKLTGDPERDIKSLSNHVFMLEEKLRYTLRNLDVTNFNDLGLARYENGRLQVYTKAVEIQTDKLRVEFGEETDEIHALLSATADELMAEIEDVEGNYTTLKATVNGIQSTVSSHTTSINNQAATNTSLQSQITQTANKISAVVSAVDDSSGNVTAASIVAAINAAGSSVRISADHVELVGDYVTISDLQTGGAVVIDAGNISAGVIEGVELYSEGYSITGDPLLTSYVRIYGGYVEFTGERKIYSAWGDMYIEMPGKADKLYITHGGNYWEFAAGYISYNGTVVLEV